MEVHPSLMTCNVTDGLTEDAVSARLHQGGIKNEDTFLCCKHYYMKRFGPSLLHMCVKMMICQLLPSMCRACRVLADACLMKSRHLL